MGNKLGWILAGIFGAFIIIVLVMVLFFPSPTDPTRATTSPGMLTLQKPAEPLTTLLPSAPDGEGNAADNYRQALKSYDKNSEAIEAMFKHYSALMKDEYRLTDDDVALLNSVAKHIAAGVAKKEMSFYLSEQMEVSYDRTAEAERFQSVVDAPRMLFAHYIGKGESSFADAEKCMFDVLVLSQHLIDERARVDIVRTGIGLQKIACNSLVLLYDKWNKPERAKSARDYLAGLGDMSSIYSELSAVARKFKLAEDGAVVTPNPGDIFNLVANHADRAVRVEAILGLGLVKLTCTGRGDHKRVRDLINEKLNSDDPIEQAAAKYADAMDEKDLNRLISGK